MTTRLLLVDDHSLFREGVARLLRAEQGFEVVAHCGSVSQAIEVIRSQAVDVVLLDWDLGLEKGSDFLQRAEDLGFKGKVLLVTAGINDSEAAELMRKGVAGIFTKHKSPALLIQGIREVMAGKVWFEQDLLRKVLETPAGQAERRRSQFSERERQVLSLVFEGSSNKEIAHQLGISESSVKASLQQLFAKTGVRTRSQLVRIVLEQYRDQL
jgi:two-component system, NarL family, nitrate/nitrite response regulator NarL